MTTALPQTRSQIPISVFDLGNAESAEGTKVCANRSSVSSAAGAYLTLDIWRGLAALWVVVCHASGLVVRTSTAAHPPPRIYSFGLVGFLGVQMFFVISGYCIASAAIATLKSERSTKSFVFARIRRIFPPMWLSLPLFIGYAVVGQALVAHHLWNAPLADSSNLFNAGIRFWFANFTLSQPLLRVRYISIVCWTLCYELAFYLIVALFLLISGSSGSQRRLLNLGHFLTCGCLILLIIHPSTVGYPFDLWPQFGLGILVFDLTRHARDFAARLALLTIVPLIVVFVLTRNAFVGLDEPTRLTFLFSVVFAASLVFLHRFDATLSRRPALRPLMALGAFSYSLYLTHVLTIGATTQVFKLFGAQQFVNVRFVVGVVASVAAAWVFFLIAERPFLSPRSRSRLMAERVSASLAAS